MVRPRKDYDYEKANALWNQGERSEKKIAELTKIPRSTLQRHRNEWKIGKEC